MRHLVNSLPISKPMPRDFHRPFVEEFWRENIHSFQNFRFPVPDQLSTEKLSVEPQQIEMIALVRAFVCLNRANAEGLS
jgi:hypothetical protein